MIESTFVFSSRMSFLKKNIPNVLTVARILVIPIVSVTFYTGLYYISAFLLVAAFLTDFLDGYLARVWASQSKVGKFLDPVADKMLVTCTLVMLIYNDKISGIMIFPALLVILREILVSGLREFMVTLNTTLDVSFAGKLKTAIQMFALIILTFDCDVSFCTHLGNMLLWVASIMSIYSAFWYVLDSFRRM